MNFETTQTLSGVNDQVSTSPYQLVKKSIVLSPSFLFAFGKWKWQKKSGKDREGSHLIRFGNVDSLNIAPRPKF